MNRLILFLLLLLPVAALAGDAPKSVQVTVRTIIAHAEGPKSGIPTALADLESALRPWRYASYELTDTVKATLGASSQKTVPVGGDRTATVTVVEIGAESTRLHLRVMKGAEKVLDTSSVVKKINPSFVAAFGTKGDATLIAVTVGYPK